MNIKGVNLGNWLVLEKWMSPALFEGTTAEDEYYLPRQLSKEVYEARIKLHRNSYITERDFAEIKSFGLDMVRIPYRTLSLEIVFHFLAVQKNWIKHLHGQQNMDCRF